MSIVQQPFNDGTPADIGAWIQRCLKDNKDGPLEVQFHLDAGVPFENIRTIFTALESYGIKTPYDSLCKCWGI